jgi:PAS domain S-box-containing protein
MTTTKPRSAGKAPPLSPIDQDEAWLELAMRAADMGSCAWDLEKDRFFVSARAAAILGAQPGAMDAKKGERLFAYTHPDDVEALRKTIFEAVRTGEPYKIEHRSFRVDTGEVIWVLSAGTPVRNAAGKVVRLLGIIQDITTRKVAENRREMLVAELDHRVKNVLASVQSVALQSARRAPSLEGFMKTFAGRLKAMASAHALLTTTRWRGAQIRHIVGAELGGLAAAQAHWDGPEIALTPRATNAMALALHELATNALKFGALSNDTGHVEVTWNGNKAGGVDLYWVETGGPAPGEPARQGFGVALLSNVTGRELGGEVKLEFRATGVWARISSDASAIVERGPEEAVRVEAAEPAPPQVQARVPRLASGALSKLKVLIVEDSLLLAMELQTGLSEVGAEIIGQASDVPEALAMCGPGVEAAVLDVDLKGESVRPVAEKLEKLGVPFVFATGYGPDGAAPKGFDAPVLRKPFDITQLLQALAEVTGRV